MTDQYKYAAGELAVCIGARTHPNHLTNGKEYEILYGLEGGVFTDRPFVTVVGDHGQPLSCHASRFEPKAH